MADSVRFPAVTGRSLTGRTFRLPGDFAGDLNVVLVAFQRHQQDDVDTWTPHLRPLAAQYPALRIYELPTLGRRWRLMRPMIDGGMRSGIPDSAVRAATITLYLNKSPFRSALGITGEGRIQVLLVDRAGRVHWRAEGPYTPEAGAALDERLRTAEGAPGVPADRRAGFLERAIGTPQLACARPAAGRNASRAAPCARTHSRAACER